MKQAREQANEVAREWTKLFSIEAEKYKNASVCLCCDDLCQNNSVKANVIHVGCWFVHSKGSFGHVLFGALSDVRQTGIEKAMKQYGKLERSSSVALQIASSNQ